MPLIFDAHTEYVLETDNVLLRPLQAHDYQPLLPFALNEPTTWQYSQVSAAGEEGLKNYIDDALTARQTGKEYPFIVFDKLTESYAGCTRFYDIQPANLTLQLGYTWYGQKFRGTKLNKHCKWLLLGFAFETLGAERVEFRADNNNKRSIAAMQSIGCQVEGVLRSNGLKADGQRRDSIVLSILKHEWLGGVKERLAAKL
ncbi:RimJ/RimL family protein N-acetyltransferase [Mucilaginibacter gracilis]|uniref:RimJ/RimL family protein N-acetyltransferase n=1 Tax=Mucilaginibacter gracilis TaxID=423350 RepID=A0A495J7V7_9SPHI|nr:GNAT family N-acetyltransferase [Mucilaginibacter gracilis]RKR84833.1 RimJ/RimL family protein N-acetyltransferase [Mucilaginibacter gracilis]